MNKTKRFGFCLSPQNKNLLTTLADLSGLSKAVFLRQLLRMAAQEQVILQNNPTAAKDLDEACQKEVPMNK